jgi:hypothetical protein
VADMGEQQAVEFDQALVLVVDLQRFEFLEDIGVAADRALAEDHHRTGQDVGALDRDPDRRALPGAAEIVLRPENDALAAVDVHGVLDHLAAHLGAQYLAIAPGTEGFSPSSTAEAVWRLSALMA